MADKDKEKDDKPQDRVGDALFKSRTVIISGEINMKLAKEVAAQLLALAAESDDDITVYVNSPGGHVEAGDTIHDMIKFVKPRVLLVGTGWVASAGAHIFLSVPQKDRFCLPNTRFLLHQPSGGAGGTALDIEIEAKEIVRMRERLNKVISEATGQPIERVEKDTDRNLWLSADEAVEYGILGTIVSSQDQLK